MYAMGVRAPRVYLAASLDYNLGNGVAESITCPTLVCDAEEDSSARPYEPVTGNSHR